MTYMALIYGAPTLLPTLPPDAQARWMEYIQVARDAGIYVGGNRLEDPSTATTVTMRDGKRIVSDGPFAETKEVLGGYCMFDCANLDEALDWAARCPAAHMGFKIEVRPVAA